MAEVSVAPEKHIASFDPLEWLGLDAASSVFERLDDPTAIARAGAVSTSWRRFVVNNGFGKKLCLRVCPEVSYIRRIDGLNGSTMLSAGCSSAMYQKIMEREHTVYNLLTHYIRSPANSKDCIRHCIGASSTDNFPDESIENTLVPSDRVDLRPSYWSSGGQIDPSVPECLVYRLESCLCIVEEIIIQPFKAYFQFGDPIYSAKSVRFKMGFSKLSLETEALHFEENQGLVAADYNYTWTYTSPEFPMSQENVLQSFKLPHPVLCIGGVVKIELLGRVQKQLIDGQYYVCVCYVRVLGRPLPPDLSVDTSDGATVLRYAPSARAGTSPARVSPASDTREPSRWRIFADTMRQLGAPRGWNQAILNTIFGPVPFVEEDDDVSDEEPQA